jgi:hypothetical protein
MSESRKFFQRSEMPAFHFLPEELDVDIPGGGVSLSM